MTELEKGLTRFVEKDVNGRYHFNGQFRNGEEMEEAINQTGEYDAKDAKEVADLFSKIFDHHSFTGRSGTFYKYEGLGCIYWHMVSKLLLSAQENYLETNDFELGSYYEAIKAGIGLEKSPVEYGAFPTDAYSHTPGFAGVQQPGMTGQVKEDFITRMKELGAYVLNGQLHFEPVLLSKDEFLKEATAWELPSETITLEEGSLGFTFCSVPVVYILSDEAKIVATVNGAEEVTLGNVLEKELSQSIFNRENTVTRLTVYLNY